MKSLTREVQAVLPAEAALSTGSRPKLTREMQAVQQAEGALATGSRSKLHTREVQAVQPAEGALTTGSRPKLPTREVQAVPSGEGQGATRSRPKTREVQAAQSQGEVTQTNGPRPRVEAGATGASDSRSRREAATAAVLAATAPHSSGGSAGTVTVMSPPPAGPGPGGSGRRKQASLEETAPGAPNRATTETIAARPRSKTTDAIAVAAQVQEEAEAARAHIARQPRPVIDPAAHDALMETAAPGGVTKPPGGAERELHPEMVLGGYKLVRRIGAGGMGAVWLARQLSLDRNVALKILHEDMATDPSFVVRFNREAVAAGQLVHHNIIQIHDIGADKRVHFFSMEYVNGETLGALIDREGKLDPEVAAGYVLQAARGLHYAHQHGMVHRDVKPDNLLLNMHGVVKVADLGLVKLRGAMMQNSGAFTARAEVAMGTPAYIAPEQVRDPGGVDHRADIYSLGCTFYHLLTGRPPFEADSAAAMLTMHVYDAPVPAQDVAKRIPPALAGIVEQMMAKQPDQRPASMEDVVQEIEQFLGVDGSAPFSPREEHADLLERSVQRFNASSWAKRRLYGYLAVFPSLFTALGVLAFRRQWLWVGLIALGALFFWATAFTLRGLTQKTAMFIRVRQHILGARITVWFLEFVGVGAAGLAIHIHRIHWHAVAAVLAGVALGVAWYFCLDRQVAKEWKKPVEEIERMLRSIRLRGLDENALRQFVCKYSGEAWEPFYEQLFGYDAMIAAREKWGRNDRGLPRQTWATWRDPLIRFIDARQRAGQERRSLRLLRKLEKRKLKADAAAQS